MDKGSPRYRRRAVERRSRIAFLRGSVENEADVRTRLFDLTA